jgi:organic hydroperoxide reductase OsmC/OhrA
LSTYTATVNWRCDGDFAARRYSRGHTLSFDGALSVPGTAGPANVNPRYAVEGALDPEQAFTASIAACHMLWFLDVAARAGFLVESYVDQAEGTLAVGAAGKQVMTRVVLRPKIVFSAARLPTPQELEALHHKAHEECFIANSVKTEIVIEPS